MLELENVNVRSAPRQSVCPAKHVALAPLWARNSIPSVAAHMNMPADQSSHRYVESLEVLETLGKIAK